MKTKTLQSWSPVNPGQSGVVYPIISGFETKNWLFKEPGADLEENKTKGSKIKCQEHQCVLDSINQPLSFL